MNPQQLEELARETANELFPEAIRQGIIPDNAIKVILFALAAVAGEKEAFPDIGPDPLKATPHEKWVEMASNYDERLFKACAVQQSGVPDQTALVWRIDLSRLRDACTLATARVRILTEARDTEHSARLKAEEERDRCRAVIKDDCDTEETVKALARPILGDLGVDGDGASRWSLKRALSLILGWAAEQPS